MIAGSLILVLCALLFGWLVLFSAPKTYADAIAKCGHSPVIGSEEEGKKIYYTPGDSNNKLLSTYIPKTYHPSHFHNAKFFCSIDDAIEAGYSVHACCGYRYLNN